MDQNLKNYYELLEIMPDASQEDIRKAYIRLARLYHPDHNQNTNDRRMIELNHVYEVLSSNKNKKEYDKRFIPESSYDFTKAKSDIPVQGKSVYSGIYAGNKFKKKINIIITIFLIIILSYVFIYLLIKIIGVFATLPDWIRFIIS